MKQVYYIDTLTDSVKLTTSPELVKTAHKNIFIPNFKLAKEYLEYGYKSEYDEEWDMFDVPEFGLKRAYELSEEISELDSQFMKFVQEYSQYGYSLLDFIQSEEWYRRKVLNQNYIYFYGYHRFLGIDYRDRLWKNIYKKNQYNFIRVKTKYNRSRETMIKEQAEDLFNKLDKDLKDLKYSVEQQQAAVGPEITKAKVEYSKLHNDTKIAPARANDIKNILIIYLSQRETLEKELRGCEIFISNYCRTPNVRGKICKLKDLDINDVRYTSDYGYNIYQAKDGLVSQIMYLGYGYNRLAMITKQLDICRNDDWIMIDTEQLGEPLGISGTFLDVEEYELTDNEIALEAAVNPLLTLFYKDKFDNEGE